MTLDAAFYVYVFFFFFNDTATTEIYTLSLHDALPISRCRPARGSAPRPTTWPRGCSAAPWARVTWPWDWARDRKSTRLNSSHSQISYAVFCLKKKTLPWVTTFPRASATLRWLSLESLY